MIKQSTISQKNQNELEAVIENFKFMKIIHQIRSGKSLNLSLNFKAQGNSLLILSLKQVIENYTPNTESIISFIKMLLKIKLIDYQETITELVIPFLNRLTYDSITDIAIGILDNIWKLFKEDLQNSIMLKNVLLTLLCKLHENRTFIQNHKTIRILVDIISSLVDTISSSRGKLHFKIHKHFCRFIFC